MVKHTIISLGTKNPPHKKINFYTSLQKKQCGSPRTAFVFVLLPMRSVIMFSAAISQRFYINSTRSQHKFNATSTRSQRILNGIKKKTAPPIGNAAFFSHENSETEHETCGCICSYNSFIHIVSSNYSVHKKLYSFRIITGSRKKFRPARLAVLVAP